MKKVLLMIMLIMCTSGFSKDDNKYSCKDDFKDYYDRDDDDDDHDDNRDDDDDDHDDDDDDDFFDDECPPATPIDDYINLVLVLGCVYAFKTKL